MKFAIKVTATLVPEPGLGGRTLALSTSQPFDFSAEDEGLRSATEMRRLVRLVLMSALKTGALRDEFGWTLADDEFLGALAGADEGQVRQASERAAVAIAAVRGE